MNLQLFSKVNKVEKVNNTKGEANTEAKAAGAARHSCPSQVFTASIVCSQFRMCLPSTQIKPNYMIFQKPHKHDMALDQYIDSDPELSPHVSGELSYHAIPQIINETRYISCSLVSGVLVFYL